MSVRILLRPASRFVVVSLTDGSLCLHQEPGTLSMLPSIHCSLELEVNSQAPLMVAILLGSHRGRVKWFLG